jgi:hypothetical protein
MKEEIIFKKQASDRLSSIILCEISIHQPVHDKVHICLSLRDNLSTTDKENEHGLDGV